MKKNLLWKKGNIFSACFLGCPAPRAACCVDRLLHSQKQEEMDRKCEGETPNPLTTMKRPSDHYSPSLGWHGDPVLTAMDTQIKSSQGFG